MNNQPLPTFKITARIKAQLLAALAGLTWFATKELHELGSNWGHLHTQLCPLLAAQVGTGATAGEGEGSQHCTPG